MIKPSIAPFSPKKYIQTVLYDKIDLTQKKKKRGKPISQDDFVILEFREYEKILQINHNVSQLKSMCRFYKQKVSGNKSQLIHRVYNFLKYSYYITKTQKYIRGWLRRKYFMLNGIRHRKSSVNDTDFLTLSSISKIPYNQLYCFKDERGFAYSFDIKSLYNLMVKSDGALKNPYTREILPKNTIKNIRHFIKLSRILKEPISITLNDNNNEMSHKKRISHKALSVFYRIDTFGHVTDTSWFLSLERPGLIRLVREIRDIFEYRANLTDMVKRQICPPNGNPFHGINIASLVQKNKETLQRNILYIMENLISKGVNSDSKALGAFYVLAALTLVSHNAATALPWLYQSVSQN
jgi:hypothetical protein